MSLIKVKNLKKQFQIGSETVNAIKDISFDVNAGEFISIMGPSGSGKTTLMNIMVHYPILPNIVVVVRLLIGLVLKVMNHKSI